MTETGIVEQDDDVLSSSSSEAGLGANEILGYDDLPDNICGEEDDSDEDTPVALDAVKSTDKSMKLKYQLMTANGNLNSGPSNNDDIYLNMGNADLKLLPK